MSGSHRQHRDNYKSKMQINMKKNYLLKIKDLAKKLYLKEISYQEYYNKVEGIIFNKNANKYEKETNF